MIDYSTLFGSSSSTLSKSNGGGVSCGEGLMDLSALSSASASMLAASSAAAVTDSSLLSFASFTLALLSILDDDAMFICCLNNFLSFDRSFCAESKRIQ